MRNPFRKRWAIRIHYESSGVIYITKDTQFWTERRARMWATDMNINNIGKNEHISYMAVKLDEVPRTGLVSALPEYQE